jgi:hypothetical protein
LGADATAMSMIQSSENECCRLQNKNMRAF